MAADAYLGIHDGKAGAVSSRIQSLMESGTYHPKLAHAWGWALMEEGRLREGPTEGAKRARYGLQRGSFRAHDGRDRPPTRRGEAGDQAVERGAVALDEPRARDRDRVGPRRLRSKNYGNIDKSGKAIEDLTKRKDELGSVAKGYLAWAEAELFFSLANIDKATERYEEAIKALPDFPPVYATKARTLAAARKYKEAEAAFTKAIDMPKKYRGILWDFAHFQSERKSDGALDTLARLEKSLEGSPGPEFELFRGEHYLRTGKLDKAKESFTKAAELGDDAMILLGLAKVTFEEEKAKGKKADLEKVGEALTLAYEKTRRLPRAARHDG